MKTYAIRPLFTLWLLTAAIASLWAQLCIDGRMAAFDDRSHLWLATVTEDMFGKNCRLKVTLSGEWNKMVIGGQSVDSTFMFSNVSANSMYPAILSNGKGEIRAGVIMFTFLPTIQLNGQFNDQYSKGSIIIADPEQQGNTVADIECKWRGATTNSTTKEKHNYKICFPQNISLFGMRSDDKWLLDAGQIDPFRLRNRIATDLWNDFATPPYYAFAEPEARLGAEGRVVEVFLNNQYYGIYNLSENMDRKLTKVRKCKNGQVHGCLWKAVGYDNTQMKNITTPYDNRQAVWGRFEVKYPDLSDNDTTDWSTLYNAIYFTIHSRREQFCAEADKYFDLPVLIDFYLFTNVLAAVDNHGKNTLWAVYDKQTDCRITPIPWDLDCTVGQPWTLRFGSQYTSPYYPLHSAVFVIDRLLRSNAFGFADKVVERYHQLRYRCFATDSLISRYQHYYDMLANSGAAQRETDRWNGSSDLESNSIDFSRDMAYISEWIKKRMAYLDTNLSSAARLSVEQPTTTANTDNSVYSLSGTRMPGTAETQMSGIYISKGRKIIVKP